MNLHQAGKNDWYRITNVAGESTKVHIYDEIGFFGVEASDLIKDLEGIKGPLEVHLNSPGGEVFDGVAIYEYLVNRSGVTTVVDSLAASITSVIACAGNPVLMSRNAEMMIHNGHTMAIGDADDLRKMVENLDRASNKIANIYADRTGKPASHWLALMEKETWFTAKEAVEAGLADKVLDYAGVSRSDISNHWDLDGVFRNGSVTNVDNATKPPFIGHDQTMHRPMTGRHSHHHAAFGHPDHDDGQHDHMHEHTNDATHDHGHDSAGNTPSDNGPDRQYWDRWTPEGIPIGETAVHVMMSMPPVWDKWDGSAAMAKCHSASDFRSVCAGRRAGDATLEKTWALPHHDTPGGPANPDGVSAALGRIDSTEGLTNKEAARKHLESHQGSSKKGDSENHHHSHEGLAELSDEEVALYMKNLKEATL